MPDTDTAITKNAYQQRAGSGNAAIPTQSRSWPWALGSMSVALVILVGAFIGRHLILTAQQPPTVSPPTTPPLPVIAITSPRVGYQITALDITSGRLVALASDAALDCPPPPAGDCPPAPILATFSVLDGATGATIATTPLTGAASAATQSIALLTDSATHRAYAIAPRAVIVFSTTTGAALASYTLPTDITWQRESGAALDPTSHALFLAGPGQALALDTTTGHILARQPLPASTSIEGPALDTASSHLYLLLRDTPAAAPTLAIYDTATLAPQTRLTLPAGTHLGPLDGATHTLYMFAADGSVQTLALSATLPANGTPALANRPALRGSLALGWNGATHHLYTAGATDITVRDASTGAARAALPLRVAWNPSAPLLVDTTRGLLYLSDARGVITFVRDPAVAGAPLGLTSGAASLLARAALAHFLPDTHQDPPFLSPASFPLSDGTAPTVTRDARYWIHFSDLGWRSAGPGTAQTSIKPDGARAGGYLVTFTISWHQSFTRTHTWACAVAPDGSVQLRADTGDVVP